MEMDTEMEMGAQCPWFNSNEWVRAFLTVDNYQRNEV